MSPIVLVPMFIRSLLMARRGRVAPAVVWSFGIASVLAVALVVVLSLPQDQTTITDSGGAQIVNQYNGAAARRSRGRPGLAPTRVSRR